MIDRPNLSQKTRELKRLFDLPQAHPTAGECLRCANIAGHILKGVGFQVDIVQIQHKSAVRVSLFVKGTSGEEWLVAYNGWHQAVRLSYAGNEYFFDSICYQHYGRMPRSRSEYADLWPEVDLPILIYFHIGLPDMVRLSDVKQLDEVEGSIQYLGDHR